MTESTNSNPLINPDSSEQVSIARSAAIGMAAIALVGFVVSYGLDEGDAKSRSAASIAGVTELQRRLFREEGGRLYVAVPPNAVQVEGNTAPLQSSQMARVVRSDTSSMVASLPMPESKPLPTKSEIATEATPPQPVEETTQPDEPAPAPSTLDAPYERKPTEQVRDEPPGDDEVSTAARVGDEETTDDPAWSESEPDEPSRDEPAWDDEPSSDQMMDDESPPDEEPFETHERS